MTRSQDPTCGSWSNTKKLEELSQMLRKSLKQEGKVGESNWLSDRQWNCNIWEQALEEKQLRLSKEWISWIKHN